MKVKCIHIPGSKIPEGVLASGATQETIFHVTWNSLYTVYAMSIWKGMLNYLILNDDNHRPDWYPACLFEVADSLLPFDWHFGFVGEKLGWPLFPIWGYPELVLDGGKHYLALIERDPVALAIFEKQIASANREPGQSIPNHPTVRDFGREN